LNKGTVGTGLVLLVLAGGTYLYIKDTCAPLASLSNLFEAYLGLNMMFKIVRHFYLKRTSLRRIGDHPPPLFQGI